MFSTMILEASSSFSLINFLTITVLVILIYKILGEIRARQEASKVFKKGNIPTLPVRNLLTGNLTDLIFHPNNLKLLDKHHEKLGDTFGTFYGPYPWAFTCDPELLYRLFVKESQKFVNLNDYHMPYAAQLSKALPQLRDDEWRILRKALDPTFSMKQMKSDNVISNLENSTSRIIKEIIETKPVERLLAGAGDGRIVDVLYLSEVHSLSIIYRVAFGGQKDLPFDTIDDILKITRSQASHAFNSFPVYASIVLGDWAKGFFQRLLPFSSVWPAIQTIEQLLKDSIEGRRKLSRHEVKRNRTMVDTILETVERHKLDDDVLMGNLFFFFLAGFDTTAASITILLWLLARHPEKQAKLRDSIIGEGEASEYLTWCITESLRLYPTVPTGIGRELSEDYHYKGMTFFKGTSIVGSTYTMHRLQKYWGEDAHEFRPERHADPLKHPFQYLAFGGGPRICPGMNLSTIEIRNIVSRLIVKYQFFTCPTTPKVLSFTSPNLFHLIIHGKIELGLVEILEVQK